MHNFEELMKNSDDPRYGEITILYNPQNPSERVIKKLKKFDNKEAYLENIEFGKARFEANSTNLLELKDIQINEEDLEVQYLYEYLDDLLNLKELSSYEIIMLFKDILKAILLLEDKDMFHGDLRPDFIYFDKISQNFVLIDNLKYDGDPISCQIDNIDNYRTLYLSPRFFDMILSQKEDISFGAKDEIFSLALISLSKFEDIENFQEFYNFDDEKFNWLDFQDKIDLLSKRNYDNLDKIFLMFLKSYIFVEHEKRLTSQELISVMKSIPEFQQIFKSDPFMQFKENDLMFIEQIPRLEMQMEDNEKASAFQHYNPFDFLNIEPLREERRNTQCDSAQRESFRKKMDSLIDLNNNVRIHQKAEEKNLLIITKNDSYYCSGGDSSDDKPDLIDLIKPVNFFKIKLEVESVAPNKETPFRFFDSERAAKIEQDFQSQQTIIGHKGRESRLVSVSSGLRNEKILTLKEFVEKKHSADKMMIDENYKQYLQSIGFEVDNFIEYEEERTTEFIDKRIRETVPRQNSEETEIIYKTPNDKNLNFRNFLKQNSENEITPKQAISKQPEQIIHTHDKRISIVNPNTLSKNDKLREKSARKMITKNFTILNFNKPTQMTEIRKKSNTFQKKDEIKEIFRKNSQINSKNKVSMKKTLEHGQVTNDKKVIIEKRDSDVTVKSDISNKVNRFLKEIENDKSNNNNLNQNPDEKNVKINQKKNNQKSLAFAQNQKNFVKNQKSIEFELQKKKGMKNQKSYDFQNSQKSQDLERIEENLRNFKLQNKLKNAEFGNIKETSIVNNIIKNQDNSQMLKSPDVLQKTIYFENDKKYLTTNSIKPEQTLKPRITSFDNISDNYQKNIYLNNKIVNKEPEIHYNQKTSILQYQNSPSIQNYSRNELPVRSSNFVDCYTPEFINDHRQRKIKSTKEAFKNTNIYNQNNLIERESLASNNQRSNVNFDKNLYLYDKPKFITNQSNQQTEFQANNFNVNNAELLFKPLNNNGNTGTHSNINSPFNNNSYQPYVNTNTFNYVNNNKMNNLPSYSFAKNTNYNLPKETSYLSQNNIAYNFSNNNNNGQKIDEYVFGEGERMSRSSIWVNNTFQKKNPTVIQNPEFPTGTGNPNPLKNTFYSHRDFKKKDN